MGLRLRVAGRMAIETDGGVVDEALLGGRRGRAAFAMLAVEHRRPVSREELAEQLWPGELPPTWESAVRAAVSKVRAFLALAGLVGDTVASAFGSYQLHLPADAVVDVDAAERDVATALGALRDGHPDRAAEAAAAARAVLSRPLLVGVEGDWVETKRGALQGLLVVALETLSAAHSAAGVHGLAVAAAEEAVAVDPFRETAHRQLMTAYRASGDRAAALKAYSRCRLLLEEELGVDPSEQTEAAYVALLGEEPAKAPPVSPARSPRCPLPVLLGRNAEGYFVGRVAEQQALSTCWHATVAGDRRVVVVTGDAGVGKTRLAAKAAVSAHLEGATVLYGRCSEDLSVAYQPVVEAIAGWARAVSDEELSHFLGPLGSELARLVPRIAGRVPELPPPMGAEPQTERFRLFEAVTGWLSALAKDGPVLMVIEDLQWAPDATVALLRHVLGAADPSPLMLLATCRRRELGSDHPVHAMIADLRRDRVVSEIELDGLSGPEVEDLLEAAASQPLDDAGRALAATIHRQTGGNAFFASELVDHLLGSEAVVAGPGGWAVQGPLVDVSVPVAVRDVVTARLGRLPDTVTATLEMAAVIGRDFEVSVLSSMEGRDEDGVLDDLDAALQDGLILATPGQSDRCRFAHDLVRGVIYDRLSPARRSRYHRRAGSVLEGRSDAEERAADLARHFTVAALTEPDRLRAIYWGRRAGDQAVAVLAFEQAAVHYQRALSLVTGEDAEQVALRGDLLRALGDAWHRADDPRHRKVLLAAVDDARALGDAGRLAAVALALSRSGWTSNFGERDVALIEIMEEALTGLGETQPALRSELMSRLAVEVSWDPDPGPAARLSADAVRLARALGDPTLLVQVLGAGRFAARGPDSLSDRLANARELVQLAAKIGSLEGGVHGHVMLADALVEAGDVAAAQAALDVADQDATRLGQPAYAVAVLLRRVGMASLTGDLVKAESLADEWFRLAARGGMAPSALHAQYSAALQAVRIQQGRAREIEAPFDDPAFVAERPAWNAAAAYRAAEAGDLERAAERLDAFLASGPAKLPHDAFWLLFMFQGAMACACVGTSDACNDLYRRLGPYPGRLVWTMLSCGGTTDLALAALAVSTGQPERAQQHFAAAERLCEAAGAAHWLARTRLSWARWLTSDAASPGGMVLARRLAQQAEDEAVKRGMLEVAAQSRALLAALT